jgi:hypothetical protein
VEAGSDAVQRLEQRGALGPWSKLGCHGGPALIVHEHKQQVAHRQNVVTGGGKFGHPFCERLQGIAGHTHLFDKLVKTASSKPCGQPPVASLGHGSKAPGTVVVSLQP